VSVTGLSKSFKKKQIVHELFKDSKITNYGLYMETQNGVCTGKCYVEFVDMEGRDRAIKSSHDKKFHGKTVSVIAIR
jgi:RNA recognition motif-containing protein